MPEPTYARDYLALHKNVAKRVTNLETGVHPTAADTSYSDTYPPTAFAITNAKLTVAASGVQTYTPMWQRRLGIVSLLGGAEPAVSSSWAAFATEEIVGTLPEPARPLAGDLVFLVPAEASPWYTTIRVTTAGALYVTRPQSTGNGYVRFEGANWTAD